MKKGASITDYQNNRTELNLSWLELKSGVILAFEILEIAFCESELETGIFMKRIESSRRELEARDVLLGGK